MGKRENTYPVSKPLAPTTSNSVGVYQWGPDYSYFIQVKIGSAEQPFYMLLDTGAANTWLMGSECKEEACMLHTRFDVSTSSSWKPSNKPFFIEYGTGNLTGKLGDDKASFAGQKFDMELGVANHTANDFKHFAFDGILGLAMSDSVTGTFLQIQKQKKSMEKVMFGLSINRDSDGVNDGQVTFGGVDRAKYTGDISYSNVPDAQKGRGEWTIPLNGVTYNGKKATLSAKYAIIDTGTSFLFAPPNDAIALFKNVPGAVLEAHDYYTEHVVPCDTTMPVTVTFNGVQWDIPAKDWLGKVGDKCKSRIYGMNTGEENDTWIFGDVFLKNVYSVFDAENGTMRIGFASKAPPPKTTSTASDASTTSTGAAKPVMPGFGSDQGTTGSVDAPTTAAADVRPTQEASAGRLGSMSCLSMLAIASVMLMVA